MDSREDGGNPDPTGGRTTASQSTAADSRSVAGRITRLLAALSAADTDGLSAAELARGVGLPHATAHRLLVELEREGVTIRRPGSRAWVLGGVVLGWGDAARRQQAGPSQFHDALRAIGKTTGETVVLTTREGWHGTHTDLVVSPTGLHIVERVGLRLPLTAGASRRAILAFLPDAERNRILSRYARPGGHRDSLGRNLALTRETGFAVSAGEITAYSAGIAVPLLSQGTPTASIMVGGPGQRVGVAGLRTALEAITSIVRPGSLLPSLDLDRTAESLALAEELRQHLPDTAAQE